MKVKIGVEDFDLPTWHDLNFQQLVDLVGPTDGIDNIYIYTVVKI